LFSISSTVKKERIEVGGMRDIYVRIITDWCGKCCKSLKFVFIFILCCLPSPFSSLSLSTSYVALFSQLIFLSLFLFSLPLPFRISLLHFMCFVLLLSTFLHISFIFLYLILSVFSSIHLCLHFYASSILPFSRVLYFCIFLYFSSRLCFHRNAR
jgi:hypothetical protein